MDWIVSALLSAVANIVKNVIKLCSVNFLTSFGINIGGKFPTIDHPGSPSLAGTVSSFKAVLSGKEDASSFFDLVFSGTHAFVNMIIATAMTLVILLIAVNLVKSVIAPLTDAEHPVSVVTRGVIAGVCVGFSYRIMLTMEYAANLLYLAFEKAAFSKAVLKGTVNPESFLSGKASASKILSKNIDSIFQVDGKTLGVDKLMASSSHAGAATTGVAHGTAEAACTLIMLFLMVMLLICFFKLLIEIVERYVLLGVMFYTSPMAFVGLTSKSGTQVFKSWARMVFSQFILMISASFFINIFIGALNMFSAVKAAAGNGSEIGITTMFVFIFALIAWLDIGVRVDQYLSSLGLNAVQCGGNLWDAALGAMKMTGGVMQSGARLGQKQWKKYKDGNKKNNPADPGAGGAAFGAGNGSTAEDAAQEERDKARENNLNMARENELVTGEKAKKAAVALAERAGINSAALNGIDSKSVKVRNGAANITTPDGGRVIIAPMDKLKGIGNYVGEVPGGKPNSAGGGVRNVYSGKERAADGKNESNYDEAMKNAGASGTEKPIGGAPDSGASDAGNVDFAGPVGFGNDFGSGSYGFEGDYEGVPYSYYDDMSGSYGDMSGSPDSGSSSQTSSTPFGSRFSMSDIASTGDYEYGDCGYGIAYQNGRGTEAEDLARSLGGAKYPKTETFGPEEDAAVSGPVHYDSGQDCLVGKTSDGKPYYYYDKDSMDYGAYQNANDVKIVYGTSRHESGDGFRQYIESASPLQKIEPIEAKTMPSMQDLGMDESTDWAGIGKAKSAKPDGAQKF